MSIKLNIKVEDFNEDFIKLNNADLIKICENFSYAVVYYNQCWTPKYGSYNEMIIDELMNKFKKAEAFKYTMKTETLIKKQASVKKIKKSLLDLGDDSININKIEGKLYKNLFNKIVLNAFNRYGFIIQQNLTDIKHDDFIKKYPEVIKDIREIAKDREKCGEYRNPGDVELYFNHNFLIDVKPEEINVIDFNEFCLEESKDIKTWGCILCAAKIENKRMTTSGKFNLPMYEDYDDARIYTETVNLLFKEFNKNYRDILVINELLSNIREKILIEEDINDFEF
ncbi:MAG: hypothetical protein UR43_C0020G0016 [candidate division TM6 bacterium GW2011_GWF2_33_332]|nr:MAG: hypothetical protein UR43_C0020G0016 [candidate division TM6 bacterium GW2011_GWF2_33_332]